MVDSSCLNADLCKDCCLVIISAVNRDEIPDNTSLLSWEE